MATSPTVLIVDDDAFARALVKEVLAQSLPRHRPLEAVDGADALSVLANERPEVVFLDLLMPNKSGIEALPEIRRKCPGAKVIVVSSMETDSMVKAALEAGAIGFIGKPFHPDEIAALLKKVGVA